MATKETIYGKLTIITKSGAQIDNLISNGIKQATANRNVTTKDSDDNDESRPTIKSHSLDFKFYASNASAANFEALQTSRDNKTIELWKFSTGIPGSKYWAGSGYIETLDYDAPHDGTLEGTGSVKVTGAMTFGTV